MRAAAAAALLALCGGAEAWGEGAGRAVFEARCASCHALGDAAPAGAGPHLARLIGRRVGGDPGFGYSGVLEAARRAGVVWDAARLERFLADPEDMFPGLWMGGNGVARAAERQALVAFLVALR